MHQTFSLKGLVPCVPNRPHGDHDYSGYNFWAPTEEVQHLGSWRSERMASEMDLKITLHLLPYLRCKNWKNSSACLIVSFWLQNIDRGNAGMCLCFNCWPHGKQSWAWLTGRKLPTLLLIAHMQAILRRYFHMHAKYILTFSLLALQIRLLFLSRFAYGWSIGYFTPSLFERLHPKIFSLLYFLLVFSRFSDDGFLWGGSHSSLCRQSHKQITLFF
jgi:hypothetical protein